MTTCDFSTPAVAAPECSTEVSTGTLVPSTLPRTPETLPVTGVDSGALLAVGFGLFVIGWLPQIVRWKIRRDWEAPR